MSTIRSPIERIRQPEYTGENRCLPCTVVNVLIAVGLAGVVGVVFAPAGVLALFVFLGVIYVRGYLVPGTPELTKRYFPERLLRLFGKEPAEGRTVEAEDTAVDGEAVEALLRDHEVVERCPDEDDLCLTADFRRVWWRRIRRFREDHEVAKTHLAAVIEVDPTALEFENGNRFTVTFDGDRIGTWDSDAAFYADLAVEPTLKEWLPDWAGLGDRTRTELIAGMRAFLEECPACEADLEPVEDVRQSCCSSRVVGVDVDCPACGSRVFSGRYR